jgi:hypothetical protein
VLTLTTTTRALSSSLSHSAPFEYNVRFDGKRALVTGASKGIQCVHACINARSSLLSITDHSFFFFLISSSFFPSFSFFS